MNVEGALNRGSEMVSEDDCCQLSGAVEMTHFFPQTLNIERPSRSWLLSFKHMG